MAAPVLASFSVNRVGGTTTLPLTKPTGLAVGDLLVAQVAVSTSSAPTIVLPSGFSIPTGGSLAWSSATGNMVYVATKIATSGDVAASSFTFDTSGGGFGSPGVLNRVTGVDTTTPVDVLAVLRTSSGSNGVFPSVTTTGADRLILLNGLQFASGAPSGSQWNNVVPSGTTLVGHTENSGVGLYYATAQLNAATAGATGTKSVAAVTLSSGNAFEAITLAIAPAASSVTGTASATLGLTAAASGSFIAPVSGAGAASLGLAASGAGATGASGSASATFGLTASAAGGTGPSGIGSATLVLSASASGTFIGPISGSGAATLSITGAGTGTVSASGVTGAGAATLTLAADGLGGRGASAAGAANLTLAAAASGNVPVSGAGAATLIVLAAGSGMVAGGVTYTVSIDQMKNTEIFRSRLNQIFADIDARLTALEGL